MVDIVTFDGPNRIITEIDTGGDNELDAVEIYSEWKDWIRSNPANAGIARAFSVVGGDPISDTQNLGSTFFLENGWRIRPAESDHKVTVVGNLFTRESGQSVFVPTLGSFTVNTETRVSSLVDSSVSRLDLTQLLQSVYIDVDNGVSGTAEGVGTPTNPVNNIVDARTIADRDRLQSFSFRGTIVLDQPYESWLFEGLAGERASTVDLNRQSVDKSKFTNCVLRGETAGTIDANECGLDIFTEIAGTFRNCGFLNNFSIQTGGTAVFASCFSEVAGSGTPICNINGGLAVSFRNYSGGIELLNVTGSDAVSVDLDPGTLIVGPTNTGGEINVRGTGNVINNGATSTINRNSLVSAEVQALTSFKGRVSLDPTSTASGTQFPNGTSSSPVNNISDALDIAQANGLSAIEFRGTIILDRDLPGFAFFGQDGVSLVVVTGRDISNCKFEETGITGVPKTVTHKCVMNRCFIIGLENVWAAMFNCLVFGGMRFQAGSESEIAYSASGQSDSVPVVLDLQDNPQTVVIRAWTGAMNVAGLSSASSNVAIGVSSGEVVLESSVTAGNFEIEGIAELTDNSSASVEDRTISGTELQLATALLANNVQVTGTNPLVMSIFEDDGTTVKATYEVTADGLTRTRTS